MRYIRNSCLDSLPRHMSWPWHGIKQIALDVNSRRKVKRSAICVNDKLRYFIPLSSEHYKSYTSLLNIAKPIYGLQYNHYGWKYFMYKQLHYECYQRFFWRYPSQHGVLALIFHSTFTHHNNDNDNERHFLAKVIYNVINV